MFFKFGSKLKSSYLNNNSFSKTQYKPVIRASICTGEKVAGFIDIDSGKFVDVMVVRNNDDLREFCGKYGVKEEEIEKIW